MAWLAVDNVWTLEVGLLVDPTGHQIRGVCSWPRVHMLAVALVALSACSLLGEPTDKAAPIEPAAENPTVACDAGGGVRTGGLLAGHIWEARVGLVTDRVTVQVDRHTTSGVAVQPMVSGGQGALHILSEGGLMVVTAHLPFGWQTRLVLPDGQEQILCRFATGPGGSLFLAAALPLVELRQAEIVDGTGQIVFSMEDEDLEHIANGQIGATEVIFGH